MASSIEETGSRITSQIDVIASLDTSYIHNYEDYDSLIKSPYTFSIPQRITCKSDERLLMKIIKFSGVRIERPMLYTLDNEQRPDMNHVILRVLRSNPGKPFHNDMIELKYHDLYDVGSPSMLADRISASLSKFPDLNPQWVYNSIGNYYTFYTDSVNYPCTLVFTLSSIPGVFNMFGFGRTMFSYEISTDIAIVNKLQSSVIQFGISSTLLVRWGGNTIEGRRLISPFVTSDDIIYVCNVPTNFTNSIDVADVEDTTPFIVLPTTDLDTLTLTVAYDKQPDYNIPFYSGTIVIRFATEKLKYISQQTDPVKHDILSADELQLYEKKLNSSAREYTFKLDNLNKSFFNYVYRIESS